MLLRGSSTRGARGQPPNRSRGPRGRGSTSRGAPSSSSKFNNGTPLPKGPRALQDSSNMYSGGFRGRNFKHSYSNFKHTGPTSSVNLPDPFEQERLENAAKREHRGQNGTLVNGRGTPRGLHNNKQVRFADSPTEKVESFSKSPSPAPVNPFAKRPNSSSSASPTPVPFNPFAAPAKAESPNPFGTPISAASTFGAPSQLAATTSIFGAPSGPPANNTTPRPSKNPSTVIFGASSPPQSNAFGNAPPKANGVFGGSFGSQPPSSQPATNPFGAPSSSEFSGLSSTLSSTAPPTLGSPSTNNFVSSTSTTIPKNMTNGFVSKPNSPLPSKLVSLAPSSIPTSTSSTDMARKIDQLLRKDGISAPPRPTSALGDPKQKSVVEAFWKSSKAYRDKVRTSLIRAGYLDDPDKPKKLSEAIDFMGTCEDMCPEYEKIVRVMEHDVPGPEKEIAPDGSFWPSPQKMVKALARSAAGQDAPLPMDVRSPAALRRTLDYLLHTVLGDEKNLPSVEGYLWNRTRAIRRDFTFLTFSMSGNELVDYIYCLERITRYHVIALHHMSHEDVNVGEYSEQQEVEQLGKALLTLIQTYEDCRTQGIECENEIEFRAYFVLFNSHDSGILEIVQNWGWKYWGESDQIRMAVNLVEALHNIWETNGKVKPYSATDIAQNAYSRFFSIIEDKAVSYTMACFAEIHFNSVRKAALKTILTSYRKQRDQTKDWTLSKLNSYLRFDIEEDIISFGEAHGLRFDEVDGEDYLSFEPEDGISDPIKAFRHPHSYALVERKRGGHSLQEVIDSTVYEVSDTENDQDEDELFVKDASSRPSFHPLPRREAVQEEHEDDPSDPSDPSDSEPSASQSEVPKKVVLNEERTLAQTPTSIFDRATKPPMTFGGNFFSSPGGTSTPTQHEKVETQTPSTLIQPLVKEPPSMFSQQPPGHATPPSAPPTFSFPQQTPTPAAPVFSFPPQPPTQAAPKFSFPPQTPALAAPTFSFPQQPPRQPVTSSPEIPLSLGKHATMTAPTQNEHAPFFQGQHPMTATPPATVEDAPQSRKRPQEQSPLYEPVFGTRPAPIPLQKVPSFGTPQAPLETTKHTSTQPIKEIETTQSMSLSGATPSAPSPVSRDSQLAGFAKWVALGDNGLIDQFTAFMVENILLKTATMFAKEEAKRIAKEEDDLARKEADGFRYRSLATKYCYLWREAAHRRWLKRRGREARKARQEMAESLRASRAAQSANVIEDFRALTSVPRRNSLESLLDATGVLNGVHNSDNEIRAIVQLEPMAPANKRLRSERSTNSPGSNMHKRGKSDNPLRRSLMSDPSYLNGGSRIHLMSNYGARDENRRQISGVQTDYFRLKARGITTLPNGTPLASSVAKSIVHQKRSFDGISKPSTPPVSKQQPIARSVPMRPARDLDNHQTSTVLDDDIEALKQRARTLVIDGKESRRKQKRTWQDDDEELFERAKRIREQMDEGMKWYRKEIERDAGSRSVS